MQRVLREIARDVHRLVQSPLVQVVVVRDGRAATAALEGTRLPDADARARAAALLGAEPAPAPALALAAPDAPRDRLDRKSVV